jgi:hypothetical protein
MSCEVGINNSLTEGTGEFFAIKVLAAAALIAAVPLAAEKAYRSFGQSECPADRRRGS